MRTGLLLALCLGLAACSVAALPFKVVGDVVEVVPLVGGVAAAPFNATAAVLK